MGDGRGCSCETGVRPSFEWNSLQGSEFRRGSVALWLAEERWNENHSKLLTPAQELCRNAQPQLWRGGTEPALFLCLLHQSNRDGGERGRGEEEGAQRERGRKDTSKRERGKRENCQSPAAVWKWISVFLLSGTVESCTQTLLLRSKVKTRHSLFNVKVKSFLKKTAKSYYRGWHIFTLNYLRLQDYRFVLLVKMCVLSDWAAWQLIRLWLSGSSDKRLFSHWLMN